MSPIKRIGKTTPPAPMMVILGGFGVDVVTGSSDESGELDVAIARALYGEHTRVETGSGRSIFRGPERLCSLLRQFARSRTITLVILSGSLRANASLRDRHCGTT